MDITKYILDTSLLEKGDIILTSIGELPSAGIRKITKSDYSHAILYVGGSSYIHSDLKGVHADNPQRLLFDSPDRATVLRIVHPEKEAVVESAIIYARRMVGTQYSKKEAAGSVVPKLRSDLKNRQFCSRLVAQSFEEAGIHLVATPAYCTPQEIHESQLLVEVLGCVRIASAAECRFAEQSNPLEKQKEITNQFFSEIRKLSGQDIQQHEQLAQYAVDHPEHDSKIVNALIASGYLDIWKMDVEINPWRYELEEFLNRDIPREELLSSAQGEIQSASRMIAQFQSQHEQYQQLHSRFQRRYFQHECDLYELLVNLHKKRRSVAEEAIISLNNQKTES